MYYPQTLVLDSITQGGSNRFGRLVISGSHGGAYAGRVAAAARVAAAVFNDASVGRNGAGVAGLRLLGALGVPAGAVSHESAPIGNGTATLERGVLSTVNQPAGALGWEEGMPVIQVVTHHASELPPAPQTPLALIESRVLVVPEEPRVWAIDSASLAQPSDSGEVLVTGSHGGLLGDDPASALRVDALAAVFNDAGVGCDGAGTRRLAALDQRGIAAFTVAATSSRIGSGVSTYQDGVVSFVNSTATRLRVEPGMSARDAVQRIRRTRLASRNHSHRVTSA